MKKEKQNGTLQKLLPILLLLVGVTVFGTGLSGLARMAGYRRATGVVTEVAAGEVYVAFPAEAGEQSASLGAISRGCAVGTRLPLLYRPDHPADAVPSDRTVNGVLTGVGAALLIVDAVLLVPLLRSVFTGNARKKQEEQPGGQEAGD